jgi:hypothetical protein
MTKLEFLKWCFDNQGYGLKAMIQSIITIQFEDEDSSGQFKKVPYAVFVEGGKYWALVNDEPVVVDGDVTQSLFHMDDILELPGDFHPCLKNKDTRTTFGLFFFNVVLFWETWHGLVDYINRPFTKPLIEGIISDLMVDDPKPGETVPEGKSPASECLKFTENCYFLEGLGAHFIKPGGVDVLVVSPAVLKRKAELLELHKHELNDPVVFTAIVDELVKLDEAEMLKGPSKNFFINKKFIHTARKRMFIAFGIEPSADGEGWQALPDSLDTGIDPKHIVDYINTAVAGSYSRSMATGDGGAQVKATLRLIGRSTVAEEDCGSPKGEPIHINSLNKKQWAGSYQIVDGKAVLLTQEALDKLVGKTINIRVTEYCTTKEGNYCKVCCGESLGKYGTRISAEVVLIPTTSMLTRMKAAHTAGGTIVRLNLATAIRT